MGLFNRITKNVGKSIKLVAKILYYVQIVIATISLIFTFYCFADGYDTENDVKLIMALVGIIVFVLTAIGSALSIVLLYGFGELIESSKKTNQNSDSIKEYMKNINIVINKLTNLKADDTKFIKKEVLKKECKTKAAESDKQLSEEDIMQSVIDRFRY